MIYRYTLHYTVSCKSGGLMGEGRTIVAQEVVELPNPVSVGDVFMPIGGDIYHMYHKDKSDERTRLTVIEIIHKAYVRDTVITKDTLVLLEDALGDSEDRDEMENRINNFKDICSVMK